MDRDIQVLIARLLACRGRIPSRGGRSPPLARQPPQRALDRLALLRALDRWIDEQRFGTRRDFALHARGSR